MPTTFLFGTCSKYSSTEVVSLYRKIMRTNEQKFHSHSEMLDYPEGGIMQFYNNPEVQKALHVPEYKDWNGCIKGAGRRRLDESFGKLPGQYLLADDQPESVVPYIAELLDDAGIRVLIYNGDRDMTTNAQGSEMCLDSMDWSGAKGWADQDKFTRGLWFADDEQKDLGGYIKKFKNLEFIVVINSGESHYSRQVNRNWFLLSHQPPVDILLQVTLSRSTDQKLPWTLSRALLVEKATWTRLFHTSPSSRKAKLKKKLMKVNSVELSRANLKVRRESRTLTDLFGSPLSW